MPLLPKVRPQRCYGGVRLLNGLGPSIRNIEKLDLAALPMIHRMSSVGLQVDLNHFAKMEVMLNRDMDEITEKVRDITGHYINLDSPDQVADLLFHKLGLKQARPKMTTSGSRESVENEVLKAIQHDHEAVPHIQEYKQCSKLKGTYVVPMPKLARRTEFGKWRMHPNFGTTRVPSGRLNCKKPNLLAMPNRTTRGKLICEGFITDPGWVYISVDESQIEPRVVAHRSGDQNLMNVYLNEEDIYSDFAISAFQIPDRRYKSDTGKWIYPGVDKDSQRFPAKTCILASIYEVTGKGLQEQMPVICKNCMLPALKHTCGHFETLWTEEKCDQLIYAFYKKYGGILTMRRRDHATALRHGMIWDDWGRILHVAAVRSVHPWVVSAALREAGNFPIQSFAQATVKVSMAEMDDDFDTAGIYKTAFNPLLQIHDEILGEVREEDAEEIGNHMIKVFENCVRLKVPIKASMATAECWGKLQK